MKTVEDYRQVKKYIIRVEQALECANTRTTKLTEAVFALEGMSSPKNRILLNELVKDDDIYLEIGVYKGSTFVAALFGNNPKYAIAIDNFSQFDPEKTNLETFKRVVTEHQIKNFNLLNADCFNIPPNLGPYLTNKNFNVYFYDGGHTEDDQYKALSYYYTTLADKFIFIVDDWNWVPTQIGTKKAIDDLKIIVHKDWTLPTKSGKGGDTNGWWNGLYIAVCEKAQ